MDRAWRCSWYEEVQNYTHASVVMLIGCKSDLNAERVVAIKEVWSYSRCSVCVCVCVCSRALC